MTDAQIAGHLLDYDLATGSRPRWRRNHKGNLVLRWAGRTLTVFEYPKGSAWYSWSKAEDGTVKYSPCQYPSEADALAAVWEAVRGGI